MPTTTHPQPFSPLFVTRLLVIMMLLFGLAAGYYRSVLQLYHVRYVKLETKYRQLQLQLPESSEGR